MVADSEIAISTTRHMAGTDAAPFLSYLGRLVSLNALVSINGVVPGRLAIRKLSRKTLVLYRTRVFDETVELSMVLFARSIKPFEQSRPAADASREANRTVVA